MFNTRQDILKGLNPPQAQAQRANESLMGSPDTGPILSIKVRRLKSTSR